MNTMTKLPKAPLFKALSDEALITEFWQWRQIQMTWNGMATAGMSSRARAKVAGGVLYAGKNVDIILAIIRQRGVALSPRA